MSHAYLQIDGMISYTSQSTSESNETYIIAAIRQPGYLYPAM